MSNKRRWMLAAPVALAAMAAWAWAGPDWPEIGDAGSFPGVGQPTRGSGPIQSINGCLEAPLGPGLPADFEDLYLIRITDPDAFSATACFTGETGGAQLVLFDGQRRARLALGACELSGPAGDPPFPPPEPLCDLDCAPGDILELEPCAQFINEGCNGGSFEPIEFGQTICGTIFDFEVGGFNDTDWYQFTVTDLRVQVTATLEPEFQGTVGIVRLPDCGSALGQVGASNRCVVSQDAVAVVGPGDYAIVVMQNELDDTFTSCGRYRVTLTGEALALTASNDFDPILPGLYYLGVSGFDNRPFSAGGLMVEFLSPFDIDGPEGVPDGFVNSFDLVRLIINMGLCNGDPPCPPDFCPPGDFDLDCDIDIEDLFALVSNWGIGPGDDLEPEDWQDLAGGDPDVGDYLIDLEGARFAVTDDCPADINLDRTVSVPDLVEVFNTWDQQGILPADIDGNGIVGVPDLVLVLGSWGDCPPDVCPGVEDCFVSHASPGCDVESCCQEVCAVDVFCCRTEWDAACVAAAELRCVPSACCMPDGSCQPDLLLSECLASGGQFPIYDLDDDNVADGPPQPCLDLPEGEAPPQCPVCEGVCRFPGDVIEAELCGEDLNGGCNSTPPAFDPIDCGVTVCGRVFANGGLRDTDWYSFSVTDPCTEVRAQLISEFPGVLFIVDGIAGCMPVVVGDLGCASDCANNQIAVAQVPPGEDYVIFVSAGNCDGSAIFEGYECDPDEGLPDGRNEYRFSLMCSECIIQGACCLDDGCEVLTEAACLGDDGDYQGDFTTCDPDPCPAP